MILGRTTTGGGGADFALIRLDPADGSLDPSFDGPASATTTFPGRKLAVPISAGSEKRLFPAGSRSPETRSWREVRPAPRWRSPA